MSRGDAVDLRDRRRAQPRADGLPRETEPPASRVRPRSSPLGRESAGTSAFLSCAFVAALATCAAPGRTEAQEGLLLAPEEATDAPSGPARGAGGASRARGDGVSPLIVGEDESLWQLFRKGGIVMPAILIASIVALAFAIERFVALRTSVQAPDGLADELTSRLSRGGMGPAVSLVKGREGVLPRMLVSALGRIEDGRAGMEEAAAAESYRGLYDLRKNVRPVGIVASVAPLMGLLGTVFGMIKAFDRVSVGSLGRGEELASGIAEALLTTGAGLVVAIPALLVYHYLRGRTEDLVRRAESETVRFIDRAGALSASAKSSDGQARGAGNGKE